jgi:hypothetical protein
VVPDMSRQFLAGLRVLAASTLALIAVAAHHLADRVATSELPTHRPARARPTTREPTHRELSDLGMTTLEVVILILGLMGIAALLVATLYRVAHNYIGQIK